MKATDPSRNYPNDETAQSNPGLSESEAAQNGSAASAASSNLVVDIYDQIYHLRGPDPKYLQQLSALVDAKMRAVAQHGTTVDSLRVAVLAALNIADELVTLRQQRDALAGNVARNIKSRAETLAEMLDAVLDDNRRAG
ncbi:MAG: cell division protein ZapA [Acidobacteriaceae bacterium]